MSTPRPGGRDPEVGFPLAIASAVLGVVGLTVPMLAWVALALAAVAYVLNTPHAPTRAFAIVGATVSLVAIVARIVG